MNPVEIIPCTSPAELYRRYHGESEAQSAYIELDLRAGTLKADYNAEIGNAIPFSVFHGFDHRYAIPVLTAEAANRALGEIAPLADRILADWEEEWDGNNMVARLGEDARAAVEEIEQHLGNRPPFQEPFDDQDKVAQWDLDGATNGSEAGDHEITSGTTDERLDEIEAEILSDLAACNDATVAVCEGLDDYLRGLRDDLRENTDASA